MIGMWLSFRGYIKTIFSIYTQAPKYMCQMQSSILQTPSFCYIYKPVGMKGTLVSKMFVKVVKGNPHGKTCKTWQLDTLKTIFSIIKNEGK